MSASHLRLASRLLVVLVAGASLSACAGVPNRFARFNPFHRPKPVEMRPVVTEMASLLPRTSPVDRLYEEAAKAIEHRNYGHALDILQIAKHAAPDDVRVLNALGVVYDKLGRFDLSNRYYQLASAADPSSSVVVRNVQYSALLRGQATALAERPAEKAPERAVPAPAPTAMAQVTVAQPTVTPRRAGPLLAGSALVILDGSGGSANQPVRTYLASAGWTISSVIRPMPAQNASEIRFAEPHRQIAEALARTLPFEVAMAPCEQDCDGLQLVLGSNAKIPRPGGRG